MTLLDLESLESIASKHDTEMARAMRAAIVCALVYGAEWW